MDVKTKLQASLSCKRFNNLVSTKSGLKGVQYSCNFDTNAIKTPSRKYEAFKIERFAGSVDQGRERNIFSLFQSQSKIITKLTFSNSEMSLAWISRILSQLPNLSSLSFQNCQVRYSNFERCPSLPKLTFLEAEHNVFPLVYRVLSKVKTLQKIVLTPNLLRNASETLYLNDSIEEDSSEDEHLRDDIIESDDFDAMDDDSYLSCQGFLAAQVNLKKFSATEPTIFARMILNCQFQLDELTLVMRIFFHQSQNLLTFLVGQTNIKKFTANIRACECEYPTPKENIQRVIELVLRLPSLNSVRIAFNDTSLLAFFKDLNIVNENVKSSELVLCGLPYYHQRVIEAVARIIPKANDLNLSLDSSWFDNRYTTPLTFDPLNSLYQLKVLKLNRCKTTFLSSIKISSLRKLKLSLLLDKGSRGENQNFKNFFKNNPKCKLYHSMSYKSKEMGFISPCVDLSHRRVLLHLNHE